MTNYEKYKDELLKISCFDNFAKQNGKITRCGLTMCKECDFSQDGDGIYHCADEREKWLDEEYIEPPTVDWSKVPVDTKIYVKNEDNDKWMPRHFAKYENGKVFAFAIGGTSFSQTSNQVTDWDYAKLAEEENV